MPHSILALLAQEAAPKGAQGSGMPLLIGLGLMIGVFYFVLIRGNRKQQKQRRTLIDNLSKNDRVMTIGGILGTVVSVRENEVVVKVDESSNTKMTFLKKAIQQVLTEGDIPTMDTK